MITCTKRYENIPFAHRQPSHAGHCRHIHGHNFSFEIEFAARELDACGFVVDFGGLSRIRDRLNHDFDHALVLNANDPLLEQLKQANSLTGKGVTVVPECSAEGLAGYVFQVADGIVQSLTDGRVTVARVTCFEDSKNSATFSAR